MREEAFWFSTEGRGFVPSTYECRLKEMIEFFGRDYDGPVFCSTEETGLLFAVNPNCTIETSDGGKTFHQIEDSEFSSWFEVYRCWAHLLLVFILMDRAAEKRSLSQGIPCDKYSVAAENVLNDIYHLPLPY